MLPPYSSGRTLTDGPGSTSTLPTPSRDPSPTQDLTSLFRGAAPQCPGEAATTKGATSSRESLPKTEHCIVYNTFSKIIKHCEQYSALSMHKSRRGTDPSEAIHTRGVEDHPTKITSGGDARDCIRYNGDRLTNPHKSGRDSTHRQGDRLTTPPHMVPEIAPGTADHNPLIMGMPILYTNCKWQSPPWLGLLKQGISPMAAVIARSHKLFAGRLSLFIPNWRVLTKDQWVLQTVTEGYHIPLLSAPKQEVIPHSPHFSSENQTLLQEEIQTLLEKQAIEIVPLQTMGFYSSMFMVSKKDGGQRPVINLKRLNNHVRSEHFKMESLHTVKSLLQKGDWMTKVDLKDAFFMVPLAQQFRHLLLFKVNAESFQFLCLPFGLCTAPRVLTKVLKPAVELLRTLGIRLVIYMDDMLLTASSVQLIQEHTYIALFLLENLGFVINNQKSILTPCQQIKFLGMTVNSQSMELKLPGEKIKKIRTEARHLLATPNAPARSLAQLLGKLNATSPALQMAPLFCRSLQMCLRQTLSANSQDYQSTITLSPQEIEDLQWWEHHLTSWNGRSLISPASMIVIDSDASLQGWG